MHTHAQCSPASVGLTQARPNYKLDSVTHSGDCKVSAVRVMYMHGLSTHIYKLDSATYTCK